MYHLVTMHSITDRQTDDIMMPIASHIACSMIKNSIVQYCL